MKWLRVTFSQTWFCGSPSFTDAQARDVAEVWASSFGPGYITGLLTLSSGATLLKRGGTLYVQAPDQVTADTFGFLKTNWSRDCIDVTDIQESGAPPAPGEEQNNVDTQHPGALQSIEDFLKSLGTDVLIAGAIVLGVVILFETGAFRGGTKTWR